MTAPLVKACLNGARRPGSVNSLPVTPSELARDAAAVVAVGAGAIHVHPRAGDGSESLDGAEVGAALAAIRSAAPGVPVGVTTGAWIESDPVRRLDLIRGWETLPGFASVNFHEDGATNIAQLLIERGVGVEAGLWTVEAAETFVASGLAPHCLRILLEPREQEPAAALATVDGIIAVVERAGSTIPRLLHGGRVTAWPLLEEALRRGLDARMGLEDTDRLPDDRPAGNSELVAAAVALARSVRGPRSQT